MVVADRGLARRPARSAPVDALSLFAHHAKIGMGVTAMSTRLAIFLMAVFLPNHASAQEAYEAIWKAYVVCSRSAVDEYASLSPLASEVATAAVSKCDTPWKSRFRLALRAQQFRGQPLYTAVEAAELVEQQRRLLIEDLTRIVLDERRKKLSKPPPSQKPKSKSPPGTPI
jgi:hypothetical protein